MSLLVSEINMDMHRYWLGNSDFFLNPLEMIVSIIVWKEKAAFFTCPCSGEITSMLGFDPFVASDFKVCFVTCLVSLFVIILCSCSQLHSVSWPWSVLGILVLIWQILSRPWDCIYNRHLGQLQLLSVTLGSSADLSWLCLNVGFSASLGWDSVSSLSNKISPKLRFIAYRWQSTICIQCVTFQYFGIWSKKMC